MEFSYTFGMLRVEQPGRVFVSVHVHLQKPCKYKLIIAKIVKTTLILIKHQMIVSCNLARGKVSFYNPSVHSNNAHTLNFI